MIPNYSALPVIQPEKDKDPESESAVLEHERIG